MEKLTDDLIYEVLSVVEEIKECTSGWQGPEHGGPIRRVPVPPRSKPCRQDSTVFY